MKRLQKTLKINPFFFIKTIHVDVTLTITSSGVVVRDLPNGGLSFLLPECQTVKNVFADDT